VVDRLAGKILEDHEVAQTSDSTSYPSIASANGRDVLSILLRNRREGHWDEDDKTQKRLTDFQILENLSTFALVQTGLHPN